MGVLGEGEGDGARLGRAVGGQLCWRCVWTCGAILKMALRAALIDETPT